MALPLIYAVYVGIAEAARALAIRHGAGRRHDAGTQELVGGMENELATARMALRQMIDAAAGGRPGIETTNEVMIGRAVAGRAAIRTVEVGDGAGRRAPASTGTWASSGSSATSRAPATTRSAGAPSSSMRGAWPSVWT